MNLIAVGINHKTAPIDIREKFFLNSMEQDLLLTELRCNPSILEAFVLSTCNRTEVYANVLATQNHFAYFIRLLANIKKVKFISQETPRWFYVYTDKEMVRHLFRVTTGLDSLVLGEKQILGQVRDAFRRAETKVMFSKNFHILANLAIRSGKKAHSETDIGYGGSSVSWAAVMMAERLLGTLQDKSILIIGAGKMGELSLSQIHKKGIQKLYLMNRTEAIAKTLARQYRGIAVGFCDIKEVLSLVDACVCSASAPHYILEKGVIEKVMKLRNNRPLFLIDISMPRNIDPKAAKVKNVTLSHIDDLEKVVSETMRKRQEAVGCVEQMIEQKVGEFYQKLAKIKDSPEFYPISESNSVVS